MLHLLARKILGGDVPQALEGMLRGLRRGGIARSGGGRYRGRCGGGLLGE